MAGKQEDLAMLPVPPKGSRLPRRNHQNLVLPENFYTSVFRCLNCQTGCFNHCKENSIIDLKFNGKKKQHKDFKHFL